MEQASVRSLLVKKMEILAAIAANTETQIRFVLKREMRGLRRLLNERELLIRGLAAVNADLEQAGQHLQAGLFQDLLQPIALKQLEIANQSAKALQAAVAERDKIAAELHSVRALKNLQNGYVRRWLPVRGNRFNEKG
jgi:hypothetical protein